ncbi:hypothetical protein [Undibacterium sp. Ji49W]|uniref:hypothetical protein n=1 Tax=Undibacterium sp. Ji49W TaxID=3413040 RepID=UPI003BF10B5A
MKIDDSLIESAKKAVDSVHSQVKGVKAVVISTEDGFEVASRVESTALVTRLSAMSSSLASLGALAGEESNLGSCENLIIEAKFGMLLIFQIQREQGSLIMSVVAGRDAIVGQVLYFAKQAARNLQHT